MDEQTRRILATAKGIVAAGWRQGGYEDDDGNRCVMKALLDAAGLIPWDCGSRIAAAHLLIVRLHDTLAAAAGLRLHDQRRGEYGAMWPLAGWQDSPFCRLSDVIALFDKVLADTAALPDTLADIEPSDGELARYSMPSPYDWAADEDFSE